MSTQYFGPQFKLHSLKSFGEITQHLPVSFYFHPTIIAVDYTVYTSRRLTVLRCSMLHCGILDMTYANLMKKRKTGQLKYLVMLNSWKWWSPGCLLWISSFQLPFFGLEKSVYSVYSIYSMLSQSEIARYLERCVDDEVPVLALEEVLSAYVAWKLIRGQRCEVVLQKLRYLIIYLQVT